MMTFRESKACVYRTTVNSQCSAAKSKLLEPLTVKSMFYCVLCKHLCPLRYARLDHHPTTLKTLWTRYEASKPTNCDWPQFHAKHAVLRIVCKDCEISFQ